MKNNLPRPTSAADITVPDRTSASSPDCLAPSEPCRDFSKEESDAIFVRLRSLKRSFGAKPNGHDLAFALIGACICEGFDTRVRIVRALKRLDIKQANIVLTLKRHEGSKWRLDGGRYRLLDT